VESQTFLGFRLGLFPVQRVADQDAAARFISETEQKTRKNVSMRKVSLPRYRVSLFQPRLTTTRWSEWSRPLSGQNLPTRISFLSAEEIFWRNLAPMPQSPPKAEFPPAPVQRVPSAFIPLCTRYILSVSKFCRSITHTLFTHTLSFRHLISRHVLYHIQYSHQPPGH